VLLNAHPRMSYFPTNSSVGANLGIQRGTSVTSGSANAYGGWTQIHAGLTYPSLFCTVHLNAVETSGDVIAATTLNAYFDIGIGPDVGNVMTIVEKLSGSQAQGLGHVYWLPVTFPANTPIWARHQNTTASAKGGIAVSWFGGTDSPGMFPTCSGIVALGAVTATTTGTSIGSVGNFGAEGSWTQIVSSTTQDYIGVMVSPLFNVDTSLTNGLFVTLDAGIGSAGNESVIGENLCLSFIWSTSEQRDAVCFPTFCSVPEGSRLTARASSSGAPDASNSVIMYGLIR